MCFWMGLVSFFGILSFKNCTWLVLFEFKKDKRPSKSPGNMQCVEQVRFGFTARAIESEIPVKTSGFFQHFHADAI